MRHLETKDDSPLERLVRLFSHSGTQRQEQIASS